LCIKQHEATGPVGQHRDGAIAHLEQERKHDEKRSSDYEEGVTIIDTLVRKELA
jgi:hypothetical protein